MTFESQKKKSLDFNYSLSLNFLVNLTMINESDYPRHVQVLIKFLRIGEIDTMNEKYQADLLIESKWIETDNINEYDPKNWKHWNPKLFIENAFQEPKQEISYNIAIENNKVVVTEIRIVNGKKITKKITSIAF